MKFNSVGSTGGPQLASLGIVALAALLGLSACAPSSGAEAPADAPAESVELGISDKDFSLDALIEAAKKEGPITVYDSTGKIVDIAENFAAEYGIDATGVKLKAGDQLELITREAQAENVRSDLFFLTDTPAAVAQLIPQKMVTSWFPPDMAEDVPAEFQDPAIVTQDANVWAYNTEVYGDTCPVSNIWALTEADWTGKLSFQDPLLKSDYMYWFNQWETHSDDLVAEAYEDYFGEKLTTTEASATAEWVKRLAQNKPILTKSDDDAAAAAGAPGQTDPFMAFVSTAKFRDNEDAGLKLGLCRDMAPWSGRAYTKIAVIANGTKSPNAAKLFVHYMYTEEGIAPQVEDGKVSTNSTIPMSADDPSGVAEIWDQIYVFESATSEDDFTRLADWQDFWMVNSR